MSEDFDGVYSHSQIASFLTCEQKYAYKYRDGWRSPRSSRAMTLGTTVHHLLDGWWSGQDIPDVESITEFVVGLRETPSLEECVSVAEHALFLLRRYDQMYAKDRETTRTVSTEEFRTFPLPQLGERKYALTTKIDKIIESPAHGGLVFIDHKTSGTRDKAESLDRDLQFTLYFLALREMGTPVTLALLDHIYTYRRKKGGEFLAWDDYPVEESFLRIPTDRTQAALDVAAAQAYAACDRMWRLRNSEFEPIRHIHFACSNCEFSAPCYDALQGDTLAEQASLKEHFDPDKERPVPVASYVPQDEVEIFIP